MSSSSSRQRRPAREGVPFFTRLRERRRLEQEQELQSQDEEEKEDDADEGASDDYSRADASGGSLIGVPQLSSRNNGSNSSRHSASATVQRVTKRTTVGINSRQDQPPTFPKQGLLQPKQFRLNEVMSLLDTVLTHLPIGSHEWECVASEHNENFPDKDRTVTSIRRKFAQLHKVKIPTGDPTCPAEVRYDKQVFRKIEERADASGEVDSTDLGIEDGNNVDDEFMILGTVKTMLKQFKRQKVVLQKLLISLKELLLFPLEQLLQDLLVQHFLALSWYPLGSGINLCQTVSTKYWL